MLKKNSKKIELQNEEENEEQDTNKNEEENEERLLGKVFEITKIKRLFKCPVCGKKFRENGNLKTHLRLHTGHRPYKCKYNDCNKSFATLGNLKSHEFNHSNNKPFKCPFEGCNNQYSRECRLDIHLRTHVGIKPFICPFEGCGKGFNEKGNLKTHVRIHTGEKPFVCIHPGCGMAFKALGHLKDHQKRHSSTKPFSCPICKNSFIRKSTMKIHMNTHGPISASFLENLEKEKNTINGKNKNSDHAKNDISSINNINENLEFKHSGSNLMSKNFSSFFDNDSNIVNQLNSNNVNENEERKILGNKSNRNAKNRNSNRVLSLANNKKNENKMGMNTDGKNNNLDEDRNNPTNIFENSNFIFKRNEITKNPNTNINNNDLDQNLDSFHNNKNGLIIKENNIYKEGILIPEAKLLNTNDENKTRDKDCQNFLKPNTTNINYSLNNLNNHLLLQNTLLANNFNAGYNNLLSNNNISNINQLSNNNINKNKNFFNLNNLQNNFSNITNNNAYPGTNYYTYAATSANNLNTLQTPNLIANNNLNNQINFNNLASHNLNKVQNTSLNNNISNPKKDIIDFTDLQSINKLKQYLHHEHETPGTGTEYNLNTISSLHSNLKDLNTIESKKKSNYSLSPFFSNNIQNFQNYFLKENNPAIINQNKGNQINQGDKSFTNSNLINYKNTTDINNNNEVKSITNYRNNENIEVINNNNKNDENNTFKNIINHQSDSLKNISFEYIKKNSNSSSSTNYILVDNNSPIENLNNNGSKNTINNNQTCDTPINNSSSNLNKSNNKKSNFTLYSKVNNINNYNSINIKINNINNTATTPNNNNYSRMGGKIQNFQDFISNINNHLNNNIVNNMNSTPSSNNSNTINKQEFLNFSNRTSNETMNDNTDQNLTPLNNLNNSHINTPISNNNNLFANNISNKNNNYRTPNMQNTSLNNNSIVGDLPNIIRNQQEILYLKKQNFETLENCINSYVIMYFQNKDKNIKHTGNYEVLNFFSSENLQNFMEKMAYYIKESPLLFKNVCEKYKYLYLDSDPEIKYVILKKILNDIERIQEQTFQTINWNLLSNVRSGNSLSHNSSGNNIVDLDSNKQEIYKYGFKDIAEKYCSNIQKTNIPNVNKTNNNLSLLINNNVNPGPNLIGTNNYEFGTPREYKNKLDCFNINLENENEYKNIFENRKIETLGPFLYPEISPNNMINNFLNLSNVNSPNNFSNMDFYKK